MACKNIGRKNVYSMHSTAPKWMQYPITQGLGLWNANSHESGS